MAHWKLQIQKLTYGYQDCIVTDDFQNVILKLVQVKEYVKIIFYLDDLLILTNIIFKDNLTKLESRNGSRKILNH
jgi:hypothetical protein